MSAEDAEVERVARLIHESANEFELARNRVTLVEWDKLPSFSQERYRYIAKKLIEDLSPQPFVVQGTS